LQAAILIELSACAFPGRFWTELCYSVTRIDTADIDRSTSDPSTLEALLRKQLVSNTERPLLVLACEQLPSTPAAAITDWQSALHAPLTCCFTALRGLVPWLATSTSGGHVVALLRRDALFPEVAPGSAAVLGRAALGLLEALRAELRHTRTRVTICITAADESADALLERLRTLLRDRPFYSLPASIDRQMIDDYFAPMSRALAQTPMGAPLPAGPTGEVYRVETHRGC
jgi:hypothetical protein